MRKFLSKILIYILIVGAISLFVNYLYIISNPPLPEHIRKFKEIPSSIELCNFGSSHGMYGFNYEDIKDVNTFNFALSAQTYSYDVRLLEYYGDHIAEGAVVLIPVSYMSLYGGDEVLDAEFLTKNTRYYRILPKRLIKEYDVKTDIILNQLPALTAGYDLIKVLLGKQEDVKDTDEVLWGTITTADAAKGEARSIVERHLYTNKLDAEGNRIINQEEIDALKLLISKCRERGFTPILITTPFLREYIDEVSNRDPDFLDGFYDDVYQIVSDTGVAYYDYSLDSRFIDNYSLFMNSDHLNKDGARIFTDILMDEVIRNLK